MSPLVFEPFLRPQIWGGRSLGERFGKRLPDPRSYGESWEVSAHPLHVSIVADGPHRGKNLVELWNTHRVDLVGLNLLPSETFPLLVKLLDCQELLSVQVHPTDSIAARLRPGELGKTEAWIVLDVAPTGEIFAGLKPGVSEADFRRHVAAGTTGDCLHRFKPNVGDCLFIPAGTVHTLGGGVLVAEVQQSSDATFRLFDWNRLGPDGKPRPLHVEESLASMDWSAGPVAPVAPITIPDTPRGVTGEQLVRCNYFDVHRFSIAGPFANPHAGQMSIWMVLTGHAQLSADGFLRQFSPGQTVLVPASSSDALWQPVSAPNSAHLLSITLPATPRS